METNVSYREINVENPQTGPKTPSTAYFPGMWLHYHTGLLAPLPPDVSVAGLNLTPVPATDASQALITFDGINSTEDRFVMPLANTLVYTGLTGTFVVGEIVIGSTSGARGKVIADNGSTTMVIQGLTGVFVPGETITGQTSGATATVSTITAIAQTDIGKRAMIAADFTSLDVFTISFASNNQFVITKVISAFQVEVAVRRLAL